MTKTALLIIDVQNGFLSARTQKVLPRIHQLIDSGDFDLIIATKFFNPPSSPFRKYMGWDKLSTPEETALEEKVALAADVVIEKSTYGAGEKISAELKKAKISKVVLVGVDTEVCVLQNAGQLFDLGYEVRVDFAGCASGGRWVDDTIFAEILGRTIGRKNLIFAPANNTRYGK